MVVTVHIDRWDITKILIDTGSQAEILFLATFNKMGFDRKQFKEPSKPLYGFGGKRIEPVRAIFRCYRHDISMQRYLCKRPHKYLRSHLAFSIPLPQNTSNLRSYIRVWQLA
jgi:hypothetical protein